MRLQISAGKLHFCTMQKKPSQRKRVIVGCLYIWLKRKSSFGYPRQGPPGTRGRRRNIADIPTRTLRIHSEDPRATQELPKGYPRDTQRIPKGYPRDQQARNTGATPEQHARNTVAGRRYPPVDATSSEWGVCLPVRQLRKRGKPVSLSLKAARQPGRIAG